MGQIKHLSKNRPGDKKKEIRNNEAKTAIWLFMPCLRKYSQSECRKTIIIIIYI